MVDIETDIAMFQRGQRYKRWLIAVALCILGLSAAALTKVIFIAEKISEQATSSTDALWYRMAVGTSLELTGYCCGSMALAVIGLYTLFVALRRDPRDRILIYLLEKHDSGKKSDSSNKNG